MSEVAALARTDRDWLELPPVQDPQPLGTDFPEYQPRLSVIMSAAVDDSSVPQLPALPPPKEPELPPAPITTPAPTTGKRKADADAPAEPVAAVAADDDSGSSDAAAKKKGKKKDKKKKKAASDDESSSASSSDDSDAEDKKNKKKKEGDKKKDKSAAAPAPAPVQPPPPPSSAPAPVVSDNNKKKEEKKKKKAEESSDSSDSDSDKKKKAKKDKKKKKEKKKEDKKKKKKDESSDEEDEDAEYADTSDGDDSGSDSSSSEASDAASSASSDSDSDKEDKKKKKHKKEKEDKKKKHKKEKEDKKKHKKEKKEEKKKKQQKKEEPEDSDEEESDDADEKAPSEALGPRQKRRLSKKQREEKLRAAKEQQRTQYKADSPDGKLFPWHLNPKEALRSVTQRDIEEATWFVKPVKSIEIGDESAIEKMLEAPDDYLGVLELKKRDESSKMPGRPKNTVFFAVMGRDPDKKNVERPVRLKAGFHKRLFKDVPYDFELWGSEKMAWRPLRGRYVPAIGEWSWEHRHAAAVKRGGLPPPAPAPEPTKSAGKRVIDDGEGDGVVVSADEAPAKPAAPAASKKSASKKLKKMSDSTEAAAAPAPAPEPAPAPAPAPEPPKKKVKQQPSKSAKIVEEMERVNKQAVNPLTDILMPDAPVAPTGEMVPDCATREDLKKHIRPADTAAARLFTQIVRDAYKNRREQYDAIVRARDAIVEAINKADMAKRTSALTQLFGGFSVRVGCMAIAQTFNIDELLRKRPKALCASTARHSRAKSERAYEAIDPAAYQAASRLCDLIELSLAQSIVAINHPIQNVRAYDPELDVNVAAHGEMTPAAFTERLTALVASKDAKELTGGTYNIGSVHYFVLALYLSIYDVEVADLDAPPKPEEEAPF